MPLLHWTVFATQVFEGLHTERICVVGPLQDDAGQSALDPHCRQVPDMQIGVAGVPEHWAFDVQPVAVHAPDTQL
jgi:hypothetical protein